MAAPSDVKVSSSKELWTGGAYQAPVFVAVNAAAAGVNTVIAGTAGKVIRVLEYTIVASGAVTVTWESSGGSVIGGPYSFAANGGASPSFNPTGKFQTLAGEGLVLFLGGAVQVGGHLEYILV